LFHDRRSFHLVVDLALHRKSIYATSKNDFGKRMRKLLFADGKKLIFQSTRDGRECDQIYTMNADGSDVKMVSTGDGRTTCSYYLPGETHSLFIDASGRQTVSAAA
jgi:Tol biopolymer transport system component